MKIAEEPITPAEFEKVNKVYQKHLGNFLVGVFGILIFAATYPMFPHKHRERPETPEEYLNQSLWALLILGSIFLYYYYRSKWALRRDFKERLKEVYKFEVLKKERLFAEKTFYIFIDDHQREEISEALYQSLAKGDYVQFSQAKYSKERLSEITKVEPEVP